MKVVPLWAVAGAGYVQGQLFMVKYFVLFGGFCAVARVDQLDAPGPPSCVSCIHRYSQIWKYVLMSALSSLVHLYSIAIYAPSL